MTYPSSPFFDRIQEWDGLGVVARHDEPTGTWIFVALHDDTLGRPTGGCRMRVYEHPAEGLRDALRLAEGMTMKWATIDLPFGGGKAVLAIPRPLEGEERRGLLRRFGELLESLQGAFSTGEDLGTTPDDMAYLATITRWVKGTGPEGAGAVDPGPYTALGVLEGMRAAVVAATGGEGLQGRAVVIQGVGDVGGPLARMLAEEGALPLLSDLDGDRARALAEELQARVVSPDEVYWTECDVYAPCAVGATLNSGTIPHLRCRVVAGSANNQLEGDADAEALRERGILYAPDYVINGGGALAFGLMHLGADDAEIHRRVAGIGATLAEIFGEAGERGETPSEAALRRVRRVLEERRRA